jgi:oxaloacetate decarboxylase alpha subunit
VEQGKRIEDMGADSIAIKDMAGLLRPYVGYELVSRLKAACAIPIHMQCHATTGLSTATNLKCIEAGIDNIDTAISSMSMTYGHSPTEALVAILEGTERDTGLDLQRLERIAGYFREVRKKYAKFEGSLRGTDSRILVAQVPGGMLTNMENQLREQNAADRLDEVLEEIPAVREDLGYIPLVTPTSQIVGTQAVLNVLTGERYKSISRETAGVLKGEYGATPAPVNASCRRGCWTAPSRSPAAPRTCWSRRWRSLAGELETLAQEKGIALTAGEGASTTYSPTRCFPRSGCAFSSIAAIPRPSSRPGGRAAEARGEEARLRSRLPAPQAAAGTGRLYGRGDGSAFRVEVSEDGDADAVDAAPRRQAPPDVNAAPEGQPVIRRPWPATSCALRGRRATRGGRRCHRDPRGHENGDGSARPACRHGVAASP